MILTEKEFNFSDAGFASELFRVGGRDMRREYETRIHSDDSDNRNSSKNSLQIYQQASACYKPEQGESNAEAAERHRLIEERIGEIKEERQRRTNRKFVRLSQHFLTSYQLKRKIAIKQRRTTITKNNLTDWGRAKYKIGQNNTLSTIDSAGNNI
jgi:hypothetical protein